MAENGFEKTTEPDSQVMVFGEEELVLRESRFILFSMSLFSTLIGVFAGVAFSFGDQQAAMFLASAALLTFAGVIGQILIGLKTWNRYFYGSCGFAIFLFVILRGGLEYMGLFGALALTPGFVAVLGWQRGAIFLGVLLSLVTLIFYEDLYFVADRAFPALVELKFGISFAGLGLFSIAWGYTRETSLAQLLDANRRVNALAYRDPLTGLLNRRAIEDFLSQRWEEYRRNGPVFAVLFCNLDNFKVVNDSFGRDFGDGILVRVANVLVRGLRSQDVVSRWGGDEFLVILPGQSQREAAKVAERLRRRVESIELAVLSEPVPLTLSIGVAGVEHALGPVDIVSLADAGLYQAKNTGKNRVVQG